MFKITGVLLDVEKNTIEVKTIENSVDTFYKLLNCKSIECPTRIIQNQKFIIVCDDEGALKRYKKPSMLIVNTDDKEILEIIFGNIFITKFDGVDDFDSLTKKEIKKILEAVKIFCGYQVIIGTI